MSVLVNGNDNRILDDATNAYKAIPNEADLLSAVADAPGRSIANPVSILNPAAALPPAAASPGGAVPLRRPCPAFLDSRAYPPCAEKVIGGADRGAAGLLSSTRTGGVGRPSAYAFIGPEFYERGDIDSVRRVKGIPV